MRIDCRPITQENKIALSLPNDPFLLEGKVVPTYDGTNWDYRIETFPEDQIKEDCFPQENYCFEDMGDKFHGFAAYVDDICAGYALVYEEWNQWLYLDNLLVSGKYRRLGVGSRLIEACMDLAASMNKRGVRLVCQDNNLQAFSFYIKNGFELGGINVPVYEGTKQEGKADLYLYKRRKL